MSALVFDGPGRIGFEDEVLFLPVFLFFNSLGLFRPASAFDERSGLPCGLVCLVVFDFFEATAENL